MKSKECKQRHRIEDVDQSIEDIFSQVSASAQVLMFYKAILRKLFEKNDYTRLGEISRTEREIEKIKERITNLQDDFKDRKISSEDFHSMKERTEKTLTGLQLKLKNLKQSTLPFKTFINKEVPMLEDIAMYYKKADGKTKKKILGCIFSGKLVLKKNKVATYEFTKTIQVLLNAIKVFISLKGIDFKGVRWNSPRNTGIRFKNSGTKKEVEICIQTCQTIRLVQSNTFEIID